MATKTKNKSTKSPMHNASSRSGLGVAGVKQEFLLQTASVIPFILKTAIILGVGYFIYYKYTNRFVEKKYKSQYPDANISDAQATSRAASIVQSKTLFGNDFNNVAEQLSGLNYNGFIKLYNAFGKHTGTLLGGELDLIEWLQNQFSQDEVSLLGGLQNHSFF